MAKKINGLKSAVECCAAAYVLSLMLKRRNELLTTRKVICTDFVLPPVEGTFSYTLKEGSYEYPRYKEQVEDFLSSTKLYGRVHDINQGAAFVRYTVDISPQSMKKALKMNAEFDAFFNVNGTQLTQNGAFLYIDVPSNGGKVLLGDLLKKNEFRQGNGMTFALGKDVMGRCAYEDIENMPHLLIAGTTGSGKTVLMHDLIISILMKHTPNEVELYLIDPKETEFKPYGALPYCNFTPSVDGAMIILNWLCQDMEERYRILAEEGVSDISEYNERHPEKIMSRKILFIDELADLIMSVQGKSIENMIVRLAQKARAAGIHLVLATQYPTVKVITGQIKANIPARIALNVASHTDSMVILDRTGAEKLMKHGDYLYMNGGEPIRLQAGLTNSNEVNNVVYALYQNKMKVIKGRRKASPTWVSKFFKGAGTAVAAIIVLCIIGGMAGEIKLRNEARRVSLSTGVDEETLYDTGSIDVIRGFEKEWADSEARLQEDMINNPDDYKDEELGESYYQAIEEHEAFRNEVDAAIEANRLNRAEAQHMISTEELRKQINDEIQSHIEEYEAVHKAKGTESYYDLTHGHEEYVPEDYSNLFPKAAQTTGTGDKAAHEDDPISEEEEHEKEEKEPEEIPFYVNDIQVSSGSPYDEIHVGDQYKQNIYYNPQGTRIPGIDEINFVNDPYHK